MTYDGSGTATGIKLYFNGALQSLDPIFSGYIQDTLGGNTIVSSVSTTLGDLRHFTNPDGSSPAINHYYFKGGQAGVSIWNAAISGACISALYSAGKFGDPSLSACSTNLVSGYSFKYESLKDDIGSNNATPTDITYTPP